MNRRWRVRELDPETDREGVGHWKVRDYFFTYTVLNRKRVVSRSSVVEPKNWVVSFIIFKKFSLLYIIVLSLREEKTGRSKVVVSPLFNSTVVFV